ncbi:MAG TPA: LLM class flavin-dependent oxidoreductase [Candidatus Limnocylindria bacterium]|nr:LLM class flavin-dependent oxidoreductase [Candidatus Limnocylindria bacterium]
MWTEDEVTHAGTHYRHDRAHSGPRPVQQPHPPILIAGGGDRILELAVKEADIVGVIPGRSATALPTARPTRGKLRSTGSPMSIDCSATVTSNSTPSSSA